MSNTAVAFALFIFLMLGGGTPKLSPAQTSTLATEAAQMDSLSVSQGESKVVGKISSDFNSFLGPDSKAVVSGLRNGQWTYTTTGPTGTATPTTVTLPTGKIGYGNVYISLALAKQQLAQYGITQPTPEQLQAALLGGSVMTLNGTTANTYQLRGILTMRSEGMGWGQIAHELGYKLGPVISSMKSSNQALMTSAAKGSGTVTGGNQSTSSTSGSVVTGSGKPVQGQGKGVLAKGSSGEGIVTGSGRSAAGSTSGIITGRGQSHAYGVGDGSHGNGGGQGKGHNK
jgi:hypothetical protein